jgi:hypothetical protein
MIGHWNSPALHRLGLMVALAAGFLAAALPLSASERPRVYTNEQYIEDVTKETSLPIDDPKAMFAFVLESLPERVKVYPTENYYYFYFYHRGTRYAGNIRLDVADRDQGKSISPTTPNSANGGWTTRCNTICSARMTAFSSKRSSR